MKQYDYFAKRSQMSKILKMDAHRVKAKIGHMLTRHKQVSYRPNSNIVDGVKNDVAANTLVPRERHALCWKKDWVRYEKRTVDDAAMVAHVLAFNAKKFGNSSDDEPYAVARELGISEKRIPEVVELFSTAWIHVEPADWGFFTDSCQRDAAAESLLRSGWLPPAGSN